MAEVGKVQGPEETPDKLAGKKEKLGPGDKFKKLMVEKVDEVNPDQQRNRKQRGQGMAPGEEEEEDLEEILAPPTPPSQVTPFFLEEKPAQSSPIDVQSGGGKISPLSLMKSSDTPSKTEPPSFLGQTEHPEESSTWEEDSFMETFQGTQQKPQTALGTGAPTPNVLMGEEQPPPQTAQTPSPPPSQQAQPPAQAPQTPPQQAQPASQAPQAQSPTQQDQGQSPGSGAFPEQETPQTPQMAKAETAPPAPNQETSAAPQGKAAGTKGKGPQPLPPLVLPGKEVKKSPSPPGGKQGKAPEKTGGPLLPPSAPKLAEEKKGGSPPAKEEKEKLPIASQAKSGIPVPEEGKEETPAAFQAKPGAPPPEEGKGKTSAAFQARPGAPPPEEGKGKTPAAFQARPGAPLPEEEKGKIPAASQAEPGIPLPEQGKKQTPAAPQTKPKAPLPEAAKRETPAAPQAKPRAPLSEETKEKPAPSPQRGTYTPEETRAGSFPPSGQPMARQEEKDTFFKQYAGEKTAGISELYKTPEKMEVQAEESVEGLPMPLTPTPGAMAPPPPAKEPLQLKREETALTEEGETPSAPPPIPGIPTAPEPTPLPPYAYLAPQTLDLFERMVGVMTIMSTSGLTETTVTLNAPQFASSVFYGAQIIIQEFETAPKAYNIQILANPQAVAAFQGNADDLMAAFQHGNYNFRVNRLETGYLKIERPLFQRKEKSSGKDTGDKREEK